MIGASSELAEGKDCWTVDGYHETRSGESYDLTFQEALARQGVRSFAELFEERRRRGQSTNVLDLMGSAIFPEATQHIDSAIGVRITDADDYLKRRAQSETARSSDRIENAFNHDRRRIVEGNVYSRRTVGEVKRQMQELGLEHFDVITCRPYRPFFGSSLSELGVEDEALAEYFAIQLKRYAELLGEGGHMFLQVPQNETVLGNLDQVSEILGDEDFECQVFDTDYPESVKVLTVNRVR